MKRIHSISIAILILIQFPLIVSCQTKTTSSNSEIIAIIDALELSIKTKNYNTLKPFLDNNFTYATYNGPTAHMIMQQVITGYPLEVQKITIKEIIKNNSIYTVKVLIETTTENELHDILISENYKILEANIVNIQVASPHGNDNQPKQSQNNLNSKTDTKKIPLINDNRKFLVNTIINGKKETFILDTGAGKTVVNSEIVDLPASGESSIMAQGSTSSLNLKPVIINNFKIGSESYLNYRTTSAPLSHLGNISGLLGADYFEDYLGIIKSKQNEIELFKLETHPNYETDILSGFDKVNSKKVSHLPVIVVTIGKKTYNLIVDTGAMSFLIDNKYKNELLPYVNISNQAILLHGAGDKGIEMENGILKELKINDKTFNDINIVFNSQPQPNHGGIKVDGIIGYDILSQGTFAINFNTGQVYLKN